MKKGLIIIALIAVLSIVPVLMTDLARTDVNVSANHTSLTDAAEQSVIMNNVYIGPVDVSGLTEQEAYDKVEALMDDVNSKKLTVNINGETDTIPMQDLDLEWTNTDAAHQAATLINSGNVIERFKAIHDIEASNYVIDLERTVDEDMVTAFIAQEAEAHDVEAVDAHIELSEDDGSLVAVAGNDGLEINQSASLLNIVTYLTHTWNGGEPVCDMKCDVMNSRGTVEELEQVHDILGSFSTDFSSSSENRYQNVQHGASKINGYTLYPGDSFSVLDHLVPFTEEDGYALAASYSNGQVEDSFGGGICQVSTTLYNALLNAELQIDERHNHSMTVSYVDPSRDAAISEDGGKDLIFTNNTDHPIYIHSETDSGILTVIIYGVEYRSEDRQIEFTSEVLSTKTAETEVQCVEDPSQPIGYIAETSSGHEGMEAVLWKTITENGQSETVQVNSSSYDAQPVTYSVGTASDSSAATADVEDAIATNNIDTVSSVVESYS